MNSDEPIKALTEADLKRAIARAWEQGHLPDVVKISPKGYFALRAAQEGWRRFAGLYWKRWRWPKTSRGLAVELAPRTNEVYLSDFGAHRLEVGE